MTNAAPALLALLLALSLPAMTVAAGSGAARPTVDSPVETAAFADVQATDGAPLPTENTSNRLPIGGDVTSAYVDADPDLGAALAIEDDAMRTAYDDFALEREFEEHPVAEREAMIEDRLEAIDEEIQSLRELQALAVREHANGERTGDQLLQTHVRTTAKASALDRAIDDLTGYADRVPGLSITGDARSLRSSLEVYQSPLRGHLIASLEGNSVGAADSTVAVRTSETGATLAMVDGGEYVLETTRYDHRDRDAEDQFEGFNDVESYAERHYPWVDEMSEGRDSSDYPHLQLYIMRIPHEQGNTNVYFDGGTGAVYHEMQSLSLDRLPSDALEETWTGDGLAMSINETPANGPIEVTVADESTGDPVDGADVLVDGVATARTDADGTAWLVPPAGPYELTVEDGDAAVNASLAAEP